MKSKISSIVLAVLAIFLVVNFFRIGEDVSNEEIVVNQYPISGKIVYWTNPGFKWQLGGKITTYYKTQQLWFGSNNDTEVQQGQPIKVTFNDASDGLIFGSMRVKLPTDELH